MIIGTEANSWPKEHPDVWLNLQTCPSIYTRIPIELIWNEWVCNKLHKVSKIAEQMLFINSIWKIGILHIT